MLYICGKFDENKIKIMHSVPLRIDYDFVSNRTITSISY